MKIGIYGGTFDPPHLGHMGAAKSAITALGLDLLLLVPALNPPHKALGADSADPADRLAMAELMADGISLALGRRGVAQVDGLELSHPGSGYTADTLAVMRARYPEDELFFLMGSDMFLTFDTWREPERIVALAGLAAFARAGGDDTKLQKQAQCLRERLGAKVALIPLEKVVELSSSEVREELRREPARSEALWCQVYGYILRHGLYGVKADLRQLSDADLRCASQSMIKAKRIAHVLGTEEEAVRLAERWGADPVAARRGAILHDCTKYLTLTEQMRLCSLYGIALDALEQKAVKLLHAKTGAALAEHIFGEPAAVRDAIFWHTTGRANMTVLEKVLYLADYIEPSREHFEGLEELRRLAYEDLDKALLLGCELTMADMETRGLEVHQNTQDAWAFLKGRTL